MLTTREINHIKRIIKEEKACGQLLCDFDDRNRDLRLMAEEFGYDVWWDDDNELHIEEKANVEELLDYYYSLHI